MMPFFAIFFEGRGFLPHFEAKRLLLCQEAASRAFEASLSFSGNIYTEMPGVLLKVRDSFSTDAFI